MLIYLHVCGAKAAYLLLCTIHFTQMLIRTCVACEGVSLTKLTREL